MTDALQADHTQHISRVGVYEHTPLDADGNPKRGDLGQPVTETIQLSKIDLSLLTQLEDFLRSEALNSTYPVLQGKPDHVQRMMIDSAMALGDRRRIGTAEFDRAVQSLSGMTYLLYLSMLAKQPATTPETARRIFSEANALGAEKLTELTTRLFAVTGFNTGAPKGDAGQELKLTKRTKAGR
jgi:hypothetical protein